MIKYISKATVFSLGSSSNVALSTSSISSILGGGDSKAFSSNEASINIIELATSRRTSEEVANLRPDLVEFGNKNFARLLIEEHNLHAGFLKNKYIDIPKDSLGIINVGVSLLREGLAAKINKNGILELEFKNSNRILVRLISYAYIDKISEFYISLKKEKAQLDYEFAVKKTDSILNVMQVIDKRLIKLDETTFFANEGLQRYNLPRINLNQEKQIIQQQYFLSVSNRENAAYKLQKETPIIKILDNPEPPFNIEKNLRLVIRLLD
ncbi:MAG: hypothetical protein IPJ81_00230 [Chitinophagaceae bacterium]|nr:hypothetical protein [Chitinophagaceae bacterium]